MTNIIDLNKISLADSELVGGKNASLGEMLQHLSREKLKIPKGFAITVAAYKNFLQKNGLDNKIFTLLAENNTSDITRLKKVSKTIQRLIMTAPFNQSFRQEIQSAYQKLGRKKVAVRSSAIAEDSSNASFAGMQETYLNVGGLSNILHAIKLVYASLFTDRAISYRRTAGFDFRDCAISVGIMPMVRSDKAVSGVMFTLDTESGFDKVIMISAAYGLGEGIVKGNINPDEFIVYKPSLAQGKLAILQRKLGDKAAKMIYANSSKPKKSIKMVAVPEKFRHKFCLTDKEIEFLAKQAMIIEKHYGRQMDIEWAKDGLDGQFYILQARPETVKSNGVHANQIENIKLKKRGTILVEGQSIGQGLGQGPAHIILAVKHAARMRPGDVLVTDMTDPDWEPTMKIASAIVTNRGGRTCHAAIIARELGIPAIVGCGNATEQIPNQKKITVSCCEGLKGYVYDGYLPYQVNKVSVATQAKLPKLPVKILLNLGNPEKAFACQFLPNMGVGLARLEFIISGTIGLHPNTVLNYAALPASLKKQVYAKTVAYPNPVEFYIEKLREGMAIIAAAFYPKEVIFRFSDFKSNEYANLLGGSLYEPKEENPMIGFRGAARYKDPRFEKCFALECIAFKRMREGMGLTNAQLMVPFVRTVTELQQVLACLKKNGLKRGSNKLKIYMMCEIPSNVILADQFLNYVDGFSIGSNDLTQLTLGLDRDSSLITALFDERDPAIKMLLKEVIRICKKRKKYIGICGQGPSDHPDFAQWLMKEGIESMSLNPDTIVETYLTLTQGRK